MAAPAGWFGSDWLEQDDDFCNACHLEPGVPLHAEIRRDYDARPAVSLAGLHGAVGHPVRTGDERAFRCIDCHGGVGFTGKARTKLLAAKDAFWWLTGHFDEPTEMAWPLLEEDCRQCHESFDDSAEASAVPNPPFHSLPVHNAALGMSCVACHLSHERGGLEELYYLHASHVRSRCAECHPEFE